MLVHTNIIFTFDPMDKERTYCGCLYFNSNALARIMTKLADEAFAPVGLTSSYAFLLMTVQKKPGINPKEIASEMQLTASTVTRLIEKMEYRGLLERKVVGRTTEVYSTEKCEDMYDEIKGCWKNLKTKYEELIGKELADELTLNLRESLMQLD